MADDVVFLNPGQAPFGRDGFPVGFSAAHQQSRIRCISHMEEVVIVGEVAYTMCRDSLSVTPRAGRAAMELAGHRITVYRKQPDGRCLLARDANTLSPIAYASVRAWLASRGFRILDAGDALPPEELLSN
jgi:ketosteroid isomerase-like protein